MMKNLYMVDCFNVVYEEIAPAFFRKHFSEEEAKRLKDHYFVDIDLGKVTLEEFFAQIQKDYPEITEEELKSVWYRKPTLNEAIVPYLEKMRGKGEVVLVSNAPKGFVEKIFREQGTYRYFDAIYSSSALHLAKPDLAIYKHVIHDRHQDFAEIYMIDDNANNLAKLDSIGVKGILFKDVKSLDPLVK